MKNARIKTVLVPLYLKLYEEISPHLKESLLPVADHVAGLLREYADVEVLPVTCTAEDAGRMVERCQSPDLGCIVTLHLSYSPSLLTAGALAALKKPILIIDTTIDRGFDDMSEDFLLRNHGIHGVMDFASVLRSMGVPYGICCGYYLDGEFRREIGESMQALLAAARYLNQNIAITGEPFEMMGDFAVDFLRLNAEFGHTVIPFPEDEMKRAMQDVSGREVDEAYVRETAHYEFSGDPSGLKTSIRQSLACEQWFARKNVSAYTMNFGSFFKVPVPFYAVNRMLMHSVGYAGEGDVLTASLGPALNALSPRAAFSEFFCPDWDRDLLIMSHMGEADPRFAKEGAKIAIRQKTALGKDLPSYFYEFETQPMEMTFVTWTKEPGDRFKLLAGRLECIDHPAMETFGAPHFVVRPKRPLRDFLKQYSERGGGHHVYVAQGNILARLREFAKTIRVLYDQTEG